MFAVAFLAGAVKNTFGSERNLTEAAAGYVLASGRNPPSLRP
jgi:hypothetical protein